MFTWLQPSHQTSRLFLGRIGDIHGTLDEGHSGLAGRQAHFENSAAGQHLRLSGGDAERPGLMGHGKAAASSLEEDAPLPTAEGDEGDRLFRERHSRTVRQLNLPGLAPCGISSAGFAARDGRGDIGADEEDQRECRGGGDRAERVAQRDAAPLWLRKAAGSAEFPLPQHPGILEASHRFVEGRGMCGAGPVPSLEGFAMPFPLGPAHLGQPFCRLIVKAVLSASERPDHLRSAPAPGAGDLGDGLAHMLLDALDRKPGTVGDFSVAQAVESVRHEDLPGDRPQL